MAWTPVDKYMLKAFHAIILIMGQQPMANKEHYWRRDPWFLQTQVPHIMTRTNFMQIWRYLHTSGSQQPDPNDRVWKLRWFLDHLNETFEPANSLWTNRW